MDDDNKLTVVPDAQPPAIPVEMGGNDVSKGPTPFLFLTPEQRKILWDPIPLDDLEIRPSGEVYASQVQYRRRLNLCFGPGGWCLREESDPLIKDNKITQKWSLWAQGVFVSVAWGDHEYYPNNRRMTWTDAWEAAKSNALVRCCKDLGIASECWSRRFTSDFKKSHCEVVQTQDGRAWRLKEDNGRPQQRPTPPPPPPQEQPGLPQMQPHSSPVDVQPPPKPAPAPLQQPKPQAQPKPRAPRQQQLKPTVPVISPEQAHHLRSQAGLAKVDIQGICENYDIERIEELPADKFAHVSKILEGMINGHAKG